MTNEQVPRERVAELLLRKTLLAGWTLGRQRAPAANRAFEDDGSSVGFWWLW